MSSGVAVVDECKAAFNEIKLKKTFRYLIFRISKDLATIIPEKSSDRGATYEDFLEDLKSAEQENECRYAIYDCEYLNNDNQQRNKLAFFLWSPEGAKIKQKMLYASSKDALKKALGTGIAKEIQANDHGDLCWDSVLEIMKRAT